MIEKKTWGTIIREFPFPKKRPTMAITIEVVKPQPARKAAVRAYFNGVSPQEPLSRIEIATWHNCLRSMMTKADTIAAEFTPKRRK